MKKKTGNYVRKMECECGNPVEAISSIDVSKVCKRCYTIEKSYRKDKAWIEPLELDIKKAIEINGRLLY